MITIISGTPGAGKTALVVDMLMDEVRKGRKVFTYGIPRLLLNVQQAGDIHQWQDGSWLQIDEYNPELTKEKGIKSTWFPRGCKTSCPYLATCPRSTHETPDSGALIVIDEAHTDFPQRASGKAPPDYVAALTVHRHQGLDFWFVTQRPSFLDPFIRGLSSRHIHLSLNAFSFTGSRTKLEWSEYQETVNRTSKLLASKTDYKPSPAVFPLYASASVHTKLDQSMPTIMKMFIGFVLLLCLVSGYAVYRVKNRVDAVKNPAPLSAQAGERSEHGGAVSKGAASSVPSAPSIFAQAAEAITPLPLVSSCLATSARCMCYTDHGVRVPLTDEQCRENAAHLNEHFKLASASLSSPSALPDLSSSDKK